MKQISPENPAKRNSLPDGFVHVSDVVRDAILEVRYYSTFNFIGDRIDGYEMPRVLLTVEAAEALKKASDDLMHHGYRIRVFDAYRPRRAVAHFIRWARDPADTRMKAFFYPDLDKSELFARGYIAEKSAHSRGSAVDLTLFDMATGKDVDMGSAFDWFSHQSHPDCCGNPETQEYTGEFPGNTPPKDGQINAVQFHHRMLLRSAMLCHGFRPIAEEWWHFSLINEPYPDTYFDHPIR